MIFEILLHFRLVLYSNPRCLASYQDSHSPRAWSLLNHPLRPGKRYESSWNARNPLPVISFFPSHGSKISSWNKSPQGFMPRCISQVWKLNVNHVIHNLIRISIFLGTRSTSQLTTFNRVLWKRIISPPENDSTMRSSGHSFLKIWKMFFSLFFCCFSVLSHVLQLHFALSLARLPTTFQIGANFPLILQDFPSYMSSRDNMAFQAIYHIVHLNGVHTHTKSQVYGMGQWAIWICICQKPKVWDIPPVCKCLKNSQKLWFSRTLLGPDKLLSSEGKLIMLFALKRGSMQNAAT